MRDSVIAARRRRWPIVLPSALVVVLAALWTGAWFMIAARVPDAIAQWRAREAGTGIIFDCATQLIAGFPFRIEVRCSDPSVELAGTAPPLAFEAADALLAWQVYQPTLVIGEFTGPLAIGERGKPASFLAHWSLAEASIRASLDGVERVSIVSERPSVDRSDGGGVLKADHIELHGRRVPGSPADNPAIDLVLRLNAASAPGLHPALASPLDAEVTGVLGGVADMAPKPWPVLFKQWQARGGSLEISKARLQQGDVIAVGAGTLSLTPRGGLSGQLQVTVVELAKALQELGIDRIVSQGDIGSAVDALDRMLPGLGAVARQNAGPSIVAGLGAIGQSTTLEGKPAVTVPLRFDDGEVMLGPFRVGRVAPLF
ncbi:MAG TPA: DUF2125 domain-containing protein [Xanthobacteraceae bacterium]|jgi:hypothetical protein